MDCGIDLFLTRTFVCTLLFRLSNAIVGQYDRFLYCHVAVCEQHLLDR